LCDERNDIVSATVETPRNVPQRLRELLGEAVRRADTDPSRSGAIKPRPRPPPGAEDRDFKNPRIVVAIIHGADAA